MRYVLNSDQKGPYVCIFIDYAQRGKSTIHNINQQINYLHMIELGSEKRKEILPLKVRKKTSILVLS